MRREVDKMKGKLLGILGLLFLAVLAAPAMAQPDLIVSDIQVKLNASGEGLPATVNVTVKNIGNANVTGTFYVTLYDNTTETLIDEQQIDSLNVSESKTVTFAWIPGSAGVFELLAVADSDGNILESNESNNATQVNVSVAPDLTVTDISAELIYGYGGSIIYVNVTNVGYANATDVRVDCYVNYVKEATSNLITVNAGETEQASCSWIPEVIGNVILTALVNYADPELSKDNNSMSKTATVLYYDLIVERIDVNLNATDPVNNPATVNVTVKNIGNANVTDTFYVTLYDNTTETLIDEQQIDSLNVSESKTVTFAWIPGSAGVFELLAVADSDGNILESNESNNATQVSVGVGPDLIVERIDVNLNATDPVNNPATVNVTVKNIGNANVTDTFYVTLYDNTTETLIDEQQIDSLNVSESKTVTFAWIPGSAGVFELLAVADSDGNILESNESNNATQVNVSVAPDLTVLDISFDQGIVKVKIANLGPVSAQNFKLRLVEEKTGKIIDEERLVLTLAPGEERTYEFSWSPGPGSWKLVATVDPYNDVAESNETNNTMSKEVNLILDLAVTSISPTPSPATLGQTITVSVKVENTGNMNVGAFDVSLLANGTEVNRTTVSGLAAGANTTLTFSWTPTAVGTYTLTAKVDPDNKIAESNEENNMASTTVEVKAPPEPWQAYDKDGNGKIETSELITAIQDWLSNKLSTKDLINVIQKWLQP
jgi:subtilase family serine protease